MTDSGRFTAAERASREPEAVAKTFHLFARNEPRVEVDDDE